MKVQFNISTSHGSHSFFFFESHVILFLSWNPKLDEEPWIRRVHSIARATCSATSGISPPQFPTIRIGHSTRVCRAILNTAKEEEKKHKINELSNSIEAMPASHTKHETNTSHHFAHIFGRRKLFDVEMLYGTCEAIEWLQQIVTPRFPDTIYAKLRDNGELVRK